MSNISNHWSRLATYSFTQIHGPDISSITARPIRPAVAADPTGLRRPPGCTPPRRWSEVSRRQQRRARTVTPEGRSTGLPFSLPAIRPVPRFYPFFTRRLPTLGGKRRKVVPGIIRTWPGDQARGEADDERWMVANARGGRSLAEPVRPGAGRRRPRGTRWSRRRARCCPRTTGTWPRRSAWRQLGTAFRLASGPGGGGLAARTPAGALSRRRVFLRRRLLVPTRRPALCAGRAAPRGARPQPAALCGAGLAGQRAVLPCRRHLLPVACRHPRVRSGQPAAAGSGTRLSGQRAGRQLRRGGLPRARPGARPAGPRPLRVPPLGGGRERLRPGGGDLRAGRRGSGRGYSVN